MRIAVISVTRNGNRISEKISEKLECERYSFVKYPSENSVVFEKLSELTEEIFYRYDGIIFICAVGIAVRCIAPFIKSKQYDPAVIAVDENGTFAVSVLSGHIGGANILAEITADIIKAVPVITTATDTGKKFSPDTFARANGLHICDINIAKLIAVEVLKGNKIGFYSEYPFKNISDELSENDKTCEYGICIADSEKNIFKNTLNLIPKKFVIGTGCKKNTDSDIFENFILDMLEKNNIDINRIFCISTIDIKKNETAIINFSRKYNIPLNFYSSSELMEVEGIFSSSDFVFKQTGTDNVCERSAVIGGNHLIIKKQSCNGVTFALSERETDIDFERRIL